MTRQSAKQSRMTGRSSAVSILFALSILVLPAQGQSGGNGLPPAGPHRPANVPENYMLTPFGYFHPSCVRHLSENDTLLADGRLQHGDGTADAEAPVCSYPRYTRGGSPVTAQIAHARAPEINGWIENANVAARADEAYSALIALWTVPPKPLSDDGQVLFYFPGLEDINDTESILQPVLTYAGGQWTMANWNCCLSNITTESTPIDVSPKDEIVGTITSNCRPGTLSCAAWTVFSLDFRTFRSTTLKHTPSDGQVFNWAFGGVMEPYYAVSCADYPPNHQLIFDVTLFGQDLRPVIDPKWTTSVNTTATPQCGYGVKAAPYRTTIDY